MRGFRPLSPNWDRDHRNEENRMLKELYADVGNISGKITDEVYEEIKENVNLNWREPVESVSNLPSNAEQGDTIMIIGDGADYGKVFRYDGSDWVNIQKLNPDALLDMEARLQEEIDSKETPNGAQEKADTALSAAKTYTNELESEIMNPESDVVKVVDEGSNSNGEYIRYSNGVQECWGRPFSQATTMSSWNVYRSETERWYYPKEFSSRPHVSVTAESYARWADIGSRPGLESVTLVQFSGGESSDTYMTNVYAVGRWK